MILIDSLLNTLKGSYALRSTKLDRYFINAQIRIFHLCISVKILPEHAELPLLVFITPPA